MWLKLKEARLRAGFTQKEIAEKLGVPLTTYSGYELGKYRPPYDTFVAFLDACDVSAAYVLGQTDDPETPKKEDPSEKNQKGLVSVEDMQLLLSNLGIIQEGQDLTDADLSFLAGIVQLLRAWFEH